MNPHPRRLALTLALALAALAPARARAAAAPVPAARLEQACAALQQAPLAAAELQVLLEVSRQPDYAPALRSRAMAAYSLTLLMQGNTNAFDRAVQALRAAYPEAPALLKVGVEAALAPCDACRGLGMQITICPICAGQGTCKACEATGKKAGAACPACKGKGTCAKCGGTRRIETACPTCRGSRQIIRPSAAIRDNYVALLAETAALIQENARFAEALRAASREPDNAARIEKLKALLQTYAHRSDLAPAQTLLAEALQARASREAVERERAAREQEARELEALRALRHAEDLGAALAALAAYLEQHPKTAALLELKTLQDELVAKRSRQQRLRKILVGSGVAVGVLFVAACLRPLLFRPKPQGSGPLPGMDKIDKSKFTDPLALTSKESRSRGRDGQPGA